MERNIHLLFILTLILRLGYSSVTYEIAQVVKPVEIQSEEKTTDSIEDSKHFNQGNQLFLVLKPTKEATVNQVRFYDQIYFPYGILEIKKFNKEIIKIYGSVGAFYYFDFNGKIIKKANMSKIDLVRLRKKIKFRNHIMNNKDCDRIKKIYLQAEKELLMIRHSISIPSPLLRISEEFELAILCDSNYFKGCSVIKTPHNELPYKDKMEVLENKSSTLISNSTLTKCIISLWDNFDSSCFLLIILLSTLMIVIYFLIKIYHNNLSLREELNKLKKSQPKEQSTSNSTHSTTFISKLKKDLRSDIELIDDPVLIDNFEGEYGDDSYYGDIFQSHDHKSDNRVKGNHLSTDLSMISILSQASLTSRRSFSDDDLECSAYSQNISSHDEFNKKIKLPCLQTSFNLRNRTMSDICSVTDCYVEEKEDKVVKTEIRKVVTTYDKSTKSIVDNQSTSSIDLNRQRLPLSFDLSDSSAIKKGLRLDAKLSHDNLIVNLRELNYNSMSSRCNEDEIPLDKLLILLNIHKMTFNVEQINELNKLHQIHIDLEKDSTLKHINKSLSYDHKLMTLKDILSESNSSLSGSFYESLPFKGPNTEIYDNGRFIKNFFNFELIGRGGFGSVFKAMHRIDKGEYAVKIIKLFVNESDDLFEQEVVKEAKTMMKIENKRIVRYITCWFELNGRKAKRKVDSIKRRDLDSNKILSSKSNASSSEMAASYIEFIQQSNSQIKNFSSSNSKELSSYESHDDISNQLQVYFIMQMEYCNGFPLSYYLENKTSNSDGKFYFYLFKEILLGLYHIHNLNIIHRDLKPANIFIHDTFRIKIGDFGLAEENKNGQLKENVGTQVYQSPEQMQGMEYNHKVDIFSLGLIYLEILCEFSTQSERRITLHSVKEMIYPNKLVENYPVELALIKRMTCSNPNVRPDSKDILLSQEFSSLCKLYEFV